MFIIIIIIIITKFASCRMLLLYAVYIFYLCIQNVTIKVKVLARPADR